MLCRGWMYISHPLSHSPPPHTHYLGKEEQGKWGPERKPNEHIWVSIIKWNPQNQQSLLTRLEEGWQQARRQRGKRQWGCTHTVNNFPRPLSHPSGWKLSAWPYESYQCITEECVEQSHLLFSYEFRLSQATLCPEVRPSAPLSISRCAVTMPALSIVGGPILDWPYVMWKEEKPCVAKSRYGNPDLKTFSDGLASLG